MSLQRYEGSASLVQDERYINSLPRLADQLAHSGFCPDTWRIKPGEPQEVSERKVADLAVIGYSLAELDLRLTVNTLPQCYVVHGRPGFMAQLQIALAARHGCSIVPLDDESGATEAVVNVLGKDGEWHRVTVTMAEAQHAGWAAKNPNYKTMPDRMLMARAVTKAISWHCPEAKFALPPADQAETPQPRPAIAAASTPGVISATRVERRTFFEAFTGLEPAVKELAKAKLAAANIPPSKDPALTSAQVARALELIWDAADEHSAGLLESSLTACEGDDEPVDAEIVPTLWPEGGEPF